jgi:nucleotide-binding universal stress UspA family protein
MSLTYPFRRIVVPTDFSSCSDAALELAGKLARDQGAEVIAVHVVETGHVPLNAVIHPGGDIEGLEVRTHMARLGQHELERRLQALPIAAERKRLHLAEGSPAATICQVAREVGADLIVMGTHGRTGLAHLLVGSVAERVVRTAKIPVLTLGSEACVDHPLDPELRSEDDG